MNIPLWRGHVDDELRNAALRALESGKYILGPECAAFELEFAETVARRHACLTNSCTAALHLTLLALGVSTGDEVLVPSMTAWPTVEPILQVGARPVFVELDEQTRTISADALRAAVGPASVGVIGVHLYGHPFDVDGVREVCRGSGLFLIEDCAQAQGASYREQPVGSYGDAACFSFYPSKNMTVAGDGGMMATDDDQLVALFVRLRNHGRADRYESDRPGFNMRFNEIQAAIGRVQLARLPKAVERRRAVASRYAVGLAGSPLELPSEAEWATHAYHLYVVRSRTRDALRTELGAHGIATELHYPVPCHLQPAIARTVPTARGAESGSLPATEALAREVVSLPMFPTLTDKEVAHVVRCVVAAHGASYVV